MTLAIALALVAAVCIGSGDFAGGVLGRRDPTPAAVLAVVGTAAVVTIPLALASSGAPSVSAAQWGGFSGLFWPVGFYALILGVAQGRVVVVIPVSGLVAALLPVLVGVSRGERPGLLVTIGLAIGLLAVLLVGLGHGGDGDRSVAWSAAMGLIGGLITGAGYLILDSASDQGVWVIAIAAIVATTITAVFLSARGQRIRPAAGTAMPGAFMAIAVVVAFVAMLRAYDEGSLTVVTVVTSQYPAVTVLLAALVWRIRPRAIQYAGIAGSLAAVALIAVGSM